MSRRQERFQEQIERFYCHKMTSNEYLQIGYPTHSLISDEYDTDHHPLLLAIHLERQIHGKDIHEITSFYGRERLGEYLRKKENVFIWDAKKAKHLSRFLGLQLPTAWTNLDSANTLMQKSVFVKTQNKM